MRIPIHPNEPLRLETLRRYDILDTPAEEEFDDLARLAAFVCNAPIALVSFVDGERQWSKARVGFGAQELPRELSFCAHAILQNEPLVIRDAMLDERFARNPLVWDDPKLRFYAGVPIAPTSAPPIGTLCVLDHVARDLDWAQLDALKRLARQATSLLEMRLAIRELQKKDEG